MDGARDPFIDKFLARVPAGIAASFTDAQLDAVRLAFGARAFGAHALELRRSIRLLGRRFYFVVLAGAERRDRARLAATGEAMGKLGNALLTAVVFLFIVSPVLLILYWLKSVAGIDLLPGGGGHDGWTGFIDQLGQVFR